MKKVLYSVLIVAVLLIASSFPAYGSEFNTVGSCLEQEIVELSIPKQLAKNVRWDGWFEFSDAAEAWAGAVYYDFELDASNKVVNVTLTGISIRNSQSCADKKSIFRKELYGTAYAMSWLTQHPNSYTNLGQMTLLSDGLATLYYSRQLSPIIKSWGILPTTGLPNWNGKSAPNCKILQSIVEMREKSIILGDNSKSILVDYGCIPASKDTPAGKPDSVRSLISK